MIRPIGHRVAPWLWCFSLGLGLTGCTVGPAYHVPAVPSAPQYIGGQPWVPARAPAPVSGGAWWGIFHDTTLNRLETRARAANQSLKGAYAAYRVAQAAEQVARAGYFPTLATNLSVVRAGGAQAPGAAAGPVNTATLGVQGSWQPDLWGAVRQRVEEGRANAEAARGDLGAATLSLEGAVAQTYFSLAEMRLEVSLGAATVTSDAEVLKITQAREQAGLATVADVASAQSALDTAMASEAGLESSAAILLHALAVLEGAPAPGFAVDTPDVLSAPPEIPPGVPSALLLRRPDLRAAERRVAAANAAIGLAQTAWFPSLTVAADGGWRSSALNGLMASPNLFWSIGPTLAATLFDGGARVAEVAQSRASYQEAVANFRQASLIAMQQVEDNLVLLAALDREVDLSHRAEVAAHEALTVNEAQYREGVAPYLNVLSAQTVFAKAQITRAETQLSRLTATVALIEALGGRWQGRAPAHAAAGRDPAAGGSQ